MTVASATTTNPYDIVNGTSSTTSTTADTTATADRFLKLLVAQMKNQDPLSPMDNAQVTSQMAQINTVTGINQLNSTVAGLSSQFVQLQAVQGASLVGHDVIVPGNKLATDSTTGTTRGGFEIASAVDGVKVEILTPSGAVAETLNLGAQSSGMHSFDWTPTTATDTTGYTFRVTANTGSTTTASTALMLDRVTAINTTGNTFNLELASSGIVPYSTVRALD